ncbi:FERM and PDZ domain-containing protein 2 [Tupaia chinensis]|uniref:FERM and PDZ domain-containing protein 2 n=1 Tax=Tupaia chinensis TaxID=246437 RepID=UPI000FFB7442|nr:FERM and PDZ domain-containing protein 2 [Tupaia chinensis]
MMKHGYVGEFEITDDHRVGNIAVTLSGKLNKCGVISPRFDVQLKDTQLPSQVQALIPSTGPSYFKELRVPLLFLCLISLGISTFPGFHKLGAQVSSPDHSIIQGKFNVQDCETCEPMQYENGMGPDSVTLASVLQVRGEALSEEEIWSLLSLAAERLLEDLRNDSSDYVVCPWSALLSAAGSLSFQDHVSHIEAAPFKAPELLQGQSDAEKPDVAQPLQLREPLHSVLLTMCEDQPRRRRPLQSVLEVERTVVEESSSVQQSRSYLLRKRLHRAGSASPVARALDCLHPCTVSERSTDTQNSPGPRSSTSAHNRCSLFVTSSLPGTAPHDLREGRRLSFGSAISEAAESSQPATPTPSQRSFLQRKEKFSRPEFVLLAGEAPVTLHLPGSVVTKKGKSYLALRDLCVVLLSGQCLEVKCDTESTAGAVFNTVMSFANLGELSYFGLAYMKGTEFFFLDNETRLCKIAPEGWKEQSQKTSVGTFTLFLRIKFFVSRCELLHHSLTRHQFYLQLRKDILEERLYCNDETLLQLAVLALQAELGNCPKEVESKAYFLVEDYIPASLIERMTALRVQAEVAEMHRVGSALWGDEAELEFLRVSQQLPEYGVLVHRIFPEKKLDGEMALGICAKGIIVYEVKNNLRIATLRFQWRETGKISTYRKKFTITSSITGKKHTFVTDSSKTCKYLLGLCSAQHRFNAQTCSGQSPLVLPDHDTLVQMANVSPAHQARSKPLLWIQRLSCSENELFASRLQAAAGGPLSVSLDNFSVDASKEAGTEGTRGSSCTGHRQLETLGLIQKPAICERHSGPPGESVCPGSQNNRRKSFTVEPGREIVCTTLSRDPQRGFGFVINEGEDTGQADPGIFISSILPGGPAEKAKKIKPGGQILALNHISLEGFTFDMAVKMIQNSPERIQLTVSQPEGVCGNTPREEENSMAHSGVCPADLSNGHRGSSSSHTQDQDRSADELEAAPAPSLLPRPESQLCPLPLRVAGLCPPSPSEINAGEIYFVELVKEDGTLGFSVTGGINTSVPYGGIYVKSIVPGGPAAKEGQIQQGDRLLQVDGVSLRGLTHRQAVQCLKGPGQAARLVLQRRGPGAAQQCPANDRMGDEHAAVPLVTALPGRHSSCVSVTDGLTFEVTLRKNAGGLGFSFVQMERASCSHLRNDLVRIKRLFPGQPAEENGAIAAGDVILAVNGRPTEGLTFQEVLHLLRGAPQEVTLLLWRPPPGVLPDLEQDWQTPVLSADKEFTRAPCTDLEQSPSLDQEDTWRDSMSPDIGQGLSLRPESFQKAIREGQWSRDRESPWASFLTRPLESQPHLCKLHQEMEALTLATSLEKDVRQNCYSVCDIRKLGRFPFSSSLTRLPTDIF